MAYHGQREVGRDRLVTEPDEVGGIRAVIVEDEHVGHTRAHGRWDPVEHFCQRGGRVVRNHEDADARLHTGGERYQLPSGRAHA